MQTQLTDLPNGKPSAVL